MRQQQPESQSGRFRATGIDDLIEIPDFGATFNPGSFSPGRPGGKARKSTEEILDRSPTPHYGSQRSMRDRGATAPRESQDRRRGGADDKTPDGTRSRKSIGEALGVEVHEANKAVAKTFIRPEPPSDLLEYPVIFNPRVTMMVSVTQPLYIGGGCIDGRLNIHIRGTRLDDIRLGRVSIDIAGVEGTYCQFATSSTDMTLELSFSRKTMFMSIASELIDEDHPPPAGMLAPAEEDQKMFWKVKPSRSFVPFKLQLPLNVGPGPFSSVRARIRYVIHG